MSGKYDRLKEVDTLVTGHKGPYKSAHRGLIAEKG